MGEKSENRGRFAFDHSRQENKLPAGESLGQWLNHWFEPWAYMHASWFDNLAVTGVSKPYQTFLLRFAYPDVCRRLDIPCAADLSVPAEWQTVLELSMAQLQQLLNAVVAAFAPEGLPLLAAEKRQLLQIGRALSLQKRFPRILALTDVDARRIGTARLTAEFLGAPVWSRWRLLFEREQVLALEPHLPALATEYGRCRTSERTLLRLWQAILSARIPTEAQGMPA